MCSTSHFPHISKGTALGMVFIQSTENSVVLLRFLEYLLFFCQKLRQYLIYSSLSHTFLSQLQEVTLYHSIFAILLCRSGWRKQRKKRKEKHCGDSFAALFSILWFGLFPQFFKDTSNKQGSDPFSFWAGYYQTTVSTSMHVTCHLPFLKSSNALPTSAQVRQDEIWLLS